ncbi:hypothetical protein [Algoriphagus yeomjeoni]|uniref:Uncharacterized protein n=1 Tax=Algoriphagus yeomjeoni TaxID=291403 RepID=A0A327PQ33_9BACT|nr:hypothetical protein [Algoriphagus yeomjeoni]RAI94169.1 hypothetical protein LV83_01077 [Algoriphagus yeomjeoni]
MKLNNDVVTDLDLLVKELVSNNSDVGSVEDMKAVLFPDKPDAYLIAMFHHLNDHRPRLLFPKPDPTPEVFWASDYLPAFYFEGGFTAIFENQEKERLEIKEKKSLELEKLTYDVRNSRRIYRTYWWTFFFALVSFVYVVIRLLAWLLNLEGIE